MLAYCSSSVIPMSPDSRTPRVESRPDDHGDHAEFDLGARAALRLCVHRDSVCTHSVHAPWARRTSRPNPRPPFFIRERKILSPFNNLKKNLKKEKMKNLRKKRL